jgi:hypothetical protein
MAGSGDESSGRRRQKMKGAMRSLFQKSKNTPTETSEQFSLPHRIGGLSTTPRRIDEAETPVSQLISSKVIAPSTKLGPANDQTMGNALEMLPSLKATQNMTEVTEPSGVKMAADSTLSNISEPDQPATDSKYLLLPGTVDKPSTTSHIFKQPTQAPRPIHELWNEAYEELREKEERVIKDYEAAMSKDIAIILGSTSLALAAPQVRVTRREQMASLLEKKIAEAKKNAWKLKYGTDNEVLLKDLAGPVINIIREAETFVNGAVSANPYASIAWAGISLLLPVSLIIIRY